MPIPSFMLDLFTETVIVTSGTEKTRGAFVPDGTTPIGLTECYISGSQSSWKDKNGLTVTSNVKITANTSIDLQSDESGISRRFTLPSRWEHNNLIKALKIKPVHDGKVVDHTVIFLP